jgi:hypothetical protein
MVRLSDKAAQILRLIAVGKNYDQILAMHPEFSYLDIFRAAEEALNLAATGEKTVQSEPTTGYEARQAEPTRAGKASRGKQAWTAEEVEHLMGLYYGGYSFTKIAAALDRTPAVVKERITATRNADLGQRRELGQHPYDGAMIEVLPGKYGPYLKWGQRFASVPRTYHPATITLEEAVTVLAARAERDQNDENE